MKQSLTILIVLFLCLACGQSDYYGMKDFPSVSKIDTHVHIRTERDNFSEQATKDNFQLVNIVVDGAGNWHSIYDQFRYAMFQQQAHPEQFRTISSFSVEGFHQEGWSQQAIQWMDSCFDQGAIGVKVWKNIGMVLQDSNGANIMLDDPRLNAVIAHLENKNKILIGHLGEPLNCWLPLEEMTTNNDRSYFEAHPEYHMYKHPELPSYQDQMQARNNRLDKHPSLNFVGAHMASIEWSVDSLGAWFDRYPHATIDLAARMGQVFYQSQQDRDKVRNFFIAYQDRIMYATDLGDNGRLDGHLLMDQIHDVWVRDWTYFATDETMSSDLIEGEFQGIHLPKSVVDKIYFGTAAQVFGFDKDQE